jgi:uncharacterized protein (TIGR03118 family)
VRPQRFRFFKVLLHQEEKRMKINKTLKCLVVLATLAWLLPTAALAQYVRTDLTSNQPGAPNTSPHLVNGWGLVQLGTSPFWISDNGTGLSTLYNGAGQLFPSPQNPLVVAIPPAPGSTPGTLGSPTGVIGNISLFTNSPEFFVSNGTSSAPAIFIFATLDGLIVGWNPNIGGNDALIPPNFTIKAGASYSGLAIATDAKSGQTFLYAADDSANREIDMYNSSFTRVRSFGDSEIPRNYAPYGIQAIGGQIWVTYTALNKAQGGFVDIFNTDGTLAKHDALHGPLHSPWGIALAPPDFGPMSNAILITNNISRGRVNAFDPSSGEFLGPLRDASGKAIEIDNVWAIQFGHDGGAANGGPQGTPHNSLFFTAGPDAYANGLFGVITPVK